MKIGASEIILSKIKIALVVFISFISPVLPLMLLTGLMILTDTITGIWKTFKLKKPFTSRKLSKIGSKLLLYNLVIITTFFLDHYLLGEFLLYITSIPHILTKVATTILLSFEVVSINENFKAITGKSLWTQFKLLVARGKEAREDIESLIPQDKSEQSDGSGTDTPDIP